jgi:excisionase family DNA binding protein
VKSHPANQTVALRSPALRPREVAAYLSVDVSKILAWLRSGTLRGIDVSARPGKRRRWRIRPEDLAAFEATRTNGPNTKGKRTSKSGWEFRYF